MGEIGEEICESVRYRLQRLRKLTQAPQLSAFRGFYEHPLLYKETSSFMKIAIFPLQVQRFDDMQGVYGRQIAREIASTLEQEEVETVVVNWFAQRGDLRAHVVIESPLPRNVVAEEIVVRGSTYGLIGQTGIDGADASLSLALVEPTTAGDDVMVRWTFADNAPRESTPWLIDQAVDSLVDFLRPQTPSRRIPAPDIPYDAWTALLIDRDTQALLHEGGFESLDHPDHAWSHLAQAITLLPWSQRNLQRDELRSRIESWYETRSDDVALRAQTAMCDLPDAREHDWQMLANQAQDAKNSSLYERALRGWTRVASCPEIPLLRLGIMLVREKRVPDAIPALEQAAMLPEMRDAAETWLGVAYETTGDFGLASHYWQRVAESGTDSRMVEIAKRFLRQRLQGPQTA